MLRTAKFHPANMKKAAAAGFINATDCADYMVRKGVPFRDAYGVVGKLVKYCIDRGTTLDELREDYGIHVFPIVTIKDIIETLHNQPVDGKVYIDDEMKAKMEAYLAEYGAR